MPKTPQHTSFFSLKNRGLLGLTKDFVIMASAKCPMSPICNKITINLPHSAIQYHGGLTSYYIIDTGQGPEEWTVCYRLDKDIAYMKQLKLERSIMVEKGPNSAVLFTS